MWVTGQPYDMNRDLNMWHSGGSFAEVVTKKEHDCVAMNPNASMEWFEDSCSSRHSFICMKSMFYYIHIYTVPINCFSTNTCACSENCDYPLSHPYYHRDMCVYLQHDPRKRERSAYAVNHKKAKQNCQNVGGYVLSLMCRVTAHNLSAMSFSLVN